MRFDLQGVLTGDPALWFIQGFLASLTVTAIGAVVAFLLGGLLLGLRIAPLRPVRAATSAVIEVIRNTPLLVQLLFWYFAVYRLLPDEAKAWIGADHAFGHLPGGPSLISAEFLVSAFGLGVFFAAYIAEDLRSGLAAVPAGQAEAARALGFSPMSSLVRIRFPQAIANAWQPLVGQTLNILKNSTLASGIGLAETAYQVRQIESYNAHALEAFAIGTLFYLVAGFALARLLALAAPRSAGDRPRS